MARASSVLIFVFLLMGASFVGAYEPGTHREIAQRVAQASVSSLDRGLQEELSLSGGIRESFRGVSVSGLRTVSELIGDGAFFEDVPDRRALNHFHNPLVESWDQAGISVDLLFLSIRGQSSIRWQQNPSPESQSGGGNWAWQGARRRYLQALTGGTRETRAAALGETFDALGH